MIKPSKPLYYLGDDESLLNARQCTTAIDSGSGGDSSGAIAAAGVGYITGGKTVTAPGTYAFSAVTTKIGLYTGASSLVAGANITVARRQLTGYGNADKGFFTGGADGSSGGATTPAAQDVSNHWSVVTDRLTYSTDVTAAVTGANLTTATEGQASVGSSTLGFIAGGRTSASIYVATAVRVTYSTEVSALVAGANLSQTRAFLAAAGSTTDGYFMSGGRPSQVKTTDKLVYSTETTSAVASILNVIGRLDIAAGGSLTKGYFVGGIGFNWTDIMDYATDVSAIGPLTDFTIASGGCVNNTLGGYYGSAPFMHIDYTTGLDAAAGATQLPVGSVHVGSVSTGIFT